MMSDRTKLVEAQESKGFPPVGSAHRQRKRAPVEKRTLLHIKGFGGGVPQNLFDRRRGRQVEEPNTETAAVNPRAGIE
jgi:hypothetical protein